MLKREHCMETLISKAQSFYSIAHFLAMAKLKQAWLCSIWLNENVPFYGTFSRHGIDRASSVLLIWLNEKVVLKSFFSQPHSINSHKKPSCSP